MSLNHCPAHFAAAAVAEMAAKRIVAKRWLISQPGLGSRVDEIG
jgi:hypothetical protein